MVFAPNTAWNPVGGIYIFAKPLNASQWQALYIGQTDNFQSRLSGHPQWNPAARLGATHIHALAVPLAANRLKLERLLVEKCQPQLNQQLR
jgi:hypothetical protein